MSYKIEILKDLIRAERKRMHIEHRFTRPQRDLKRSYVWTLSKIRILDLINDLRNEMKEVSK